MLFYLIDFNNFKLPSYNVFIALGLIIAMLSAERALSVEKLPHRTYTRAMLAMVLSLVAGFVMARLLEAFFTGQRFLSPQTGMTFYGGLMGSLVLFIGLSLIFRLPLLKLMNLLAPSLVIAHAFGRMGCFLAGCCYGIPTDLPWGVVFPGNSVPVLETGEQHALHPTQLYEALFLLGLFFILLKYRRFGAGFPLYAISYSLFRFFMEFIRADYRGSLLQSILSPAQLISIVLFAAGTFMLVVNLKKQRAGINRVSS